MGAEPLPQDYHYVRVVGCAKTEEQRQRALENEGL